MNKTEYTFLAILCLCILGAAFFMYYRSRTPSLLYDDPITIGVINYPPYSIVENDHITGLGVEIVKEAFNRINVNYELKYDIWNTHIANVTSGEIDIILDVYLTPERSTFLDFSSHHYAVYPLYFFKNSGDDIRYNGQIESMSSYTIGVVKGFYNGHAFEQALSEDKLNVIYSDSAHENMLLLKDGQINLAIETLYSGQALINKLELEDRIEIIEPEIDFLYSYVGFSKHNNLLELRDAYDKAIDSMIKDGTYQSIQLEFSLDNQK